MGEYGLIEEINELIDDSVDYDTGIIRDAGFSIGHALGEIKYIIIILLIISLMFVMAVEILYLSVPIFHDFEGRLEERSVIAGKTMRTVFRTAIRAEEISEETDKNVMILYLRMKCKFVVAVTVIIYIIINFNGLINYLRRVLSGITNSF